MPSNQLIHEKSPYLRQHADNPVAWLPWGEAAFKKAREEDKPIFLSIGYSTCHWCHVMAHESFEDERTAQVLNEHFVPIKLDREERPDVDRIYMTFVQATTGSGGWPMSVWLRPDLKPFFGGTYFPPSGRYGRPGFVDVLQYLAQAWTNDRAKIDESSESVAQHLQALAGGSQEETTLNEDLFELGFAQFERSFDERFGGFGTAPKFPRPVVLNYLLRYFHKTGRQDALEMVTHTLRQMARGGMHDHLGGGFHRYSVDEHWFVPHFEKMLYDQAQLAISYAEAFQITGEEEFAAVARDILDYVIRDMTDPEGGFYSAEDADSADPEDPQRHGEGAFYIWRQSEIETLLGPKAPLLCRYFGVEQDGNVGNDPHNEFAGRNILYIANRDLPEDSPEAIRLLFEARSQRPRPHLDNKVLTSWNALMISAFTRVANALNEARYLRVAERAAGFLLSKMYDRQSGELLRRYCGGDASIGGFADDYAFLAQAAADLFEATGQPDYLYVASDLLTRGLARFEDVEGGGFYSTLPGASDLLVRLKDDYDGAEPSANSIAADVLLRVGHLTGNRALEDRGEKTLRYFASKLRLQPTMVPQMAVALLRWLQTPEQVVLRCEESEDAAPFLAPIRAVFAPFLAVVSLSDEVAAEVEAVAPALSGLQRQGKATLYRCENLQCDLPEVFS